MSQGHLESDPTLVVFPLSMDAMWGFRKLTVGKFDRRQVTGMPVCRLEYLGRSAALGSAALRTPDESDLDLIRLAVSVRNPSGVSFLSTFAR